MSDASAIRARPTTGGRPTKPLGAFAGALVVLGFTWAHDVFISDIWFMLGPMLFSGAMCGVCVVWSYNKSIADHTTSKWFQFAGFHAAEMIVLGLASLMVLQPRFAMAELMVADDAFDRLLPPSMPLMIGAMVVGTLIVWVRFGRRLGALLPVALTQVLLVFLLGHQFAFLGLVESSSAVFVVFVEFALITVALAAAFCGAVVGGMRVLGMLKQRRSLSTLR